jgi:glycosyltransferase involved in cell wall biosynthesis
LTNLPKITISCLPVSSANDPYQKLMMAGLNQDVRLRAQPGIDHRFWGILLTGLRQQPQYIHFDWNYRYYFRKSRLLTWVSIPWFFIQLWIVRYLLGCKIVWSMHNIESHDNQSRRREEKWVQQRFAYWCSWIRVFSHSSVERAAHYLKVSSGKFRVSYHASFFGIYPDTASPQAARRFLGISEEAFVLLYFGTIRPYKGLETLLTAFVGLDDSRWRLVVAGRPYKPEFMASLQPLLAADARILSFIRFIEEEEVQFFFKGCNVVVLPYTDIENSGPALMSMMFARPVLAPRIGFMAERLAEQQALLFEPGSLMAALRQLADYPAATLEALGQANYADIKKCNWQHFSRFFT